MPATATRLPPVKAPLPQRSTARAMLENGDHLTAGEFLRRFRTMPRVKKAELISGIVSMPSPVRADYHGDPDFTLHGWLTYFVMRTRGVAGSTNVTVRLGPDDVLQPDSCVRIQPECGGKVVMDADGYLRGAPELVIEIAASTVSIDTREKRQQYRRAGVQEYIVWRTEDDAVDWWQLVDDDYRLIPTGADGLIRSHVFPGLWLDVAALLARDGSALLRALDQGMLSEDYRDFVQRLGL
jgi:Uma2 family endonuclease